MRAKTDFTRGKIAIITMVYTGAESEVYAGTIEEQCQLLLDAAKERMSDHLAEPVTRNALIQYGLDEAIEILEGEVIGNPEDYAVGPEEPAPKARREQMDDTMTAPTNEAAAEKAPRAGKYDNTIYRLKTNENWRRVGSHGHKTLQLIIDNGGEMRGKDLFAAGGRLMDLRWDLKNNADKIEAVEG